jgi:hypothetical protein
MTAAATATAIDHTPSTAGAGAMTMYGSLLMIGCTGDPAGAGDLDQTTRCEAALAPARS